MPLISLCFISDRWTQRVEVRVKCSSTDDIRYETPNRYRPHSVDNTSLSGYAAYDTGRQDDHDDDDHYDVLKLTVDACQKSQQQPPF